MENFPLTKTLPMIFSGKADCTEVPLTILDYQLLNGVLLGFNYYVFRNFYFKKII